MNQPVCGAVPPRLVLSWARVPNDRLIQVVYEWSAPWPEKYAIECHQGSYIVARLGGLTWDRMYQMITEEQQNPAGVPLAYLYERLMARIEREGGATSQT